MAGKASGRGRVPEAAQSGAVSAFAAQDVDGDALQGNAFVNEQIGLRRRGPSELDELSCRPARALAVWATLSTDERSAVEIYMMYRYGAAFGAAFHRVASLAVRPEPRLEVTHAGTVDNPTSLRQRGYLRTPGVGANPETWVRPNGDEVMLLWPAVRSVAPAACPSDPRPMAAEDRAAQEREQLDLREDPVRAHGKITHRTTDAEGSIATLHLDGTVYFRTRSGEPKFALRPKPEGGWAYYDAQGFAQPDQDEQSDPIRTYGLAPVTSAASPAADAGAGAPPR